MKKRFIAVLLCVMLSMLAGCVDKEAQEAVKNYLDTASPVLMEQEQKMLVSFSSVIGTNYTDDSTLCLELVQNTIPMATSLKSTAEGITETITLEELSEAHALYVSYVSEFEEALRMLLTAVDEQDETISAAANEKLNNADRIGKEYRTRLEELKKVYKLEE